MTRRPVGCVLVVATSLLATGCSSEEPRRAEAPKGWAACNDFFGEENIDAVDRQMADGVLRIESQLVSVDEVAKWSASLARSWEPGSTAHWMNGNTPCEIGLSDTKQQLSSEVGWSKASLEDLKSGRQPRGWRNVGGDVFASEEANSRTLIAAFPARCRIPTSSRNPAFRWR